MKFKVFYGCYLDGYNYYDHPFKIVEADSEEEAEESMLDTAYEHVSAWHGMHGFGTSEEEYEEQGGGFDEYAYQDIVHQEINDAMSVVAEEYIED